MIDSYNLLIRMPLSQFKLCAFCQDRARHTYLASMQASVSGAIEEVTCAGSVKVCLLFQRSCFRCTVVDHCVSCLTALPL